MKIKIKYFLIIGITILILALAFLTYTPNESKECSEFGRIYLTPDEAHYTSTILESNQNLVVSIPEIKRVVVGSEALACGNFDVTSYIKKQMENN